MNPIGDDTVAMDKCHIELIAAMAATTKPASILELGYGSGRVTCALLEAVHRYGLEKNYTLVDSWLDWGGQQPQDSKTLVPWVKILTSTEKDYVLDTSGRGVQFDLIVSDADHQHSHEWFNFVVDGLLSDGGVAFFHDVANPNYPNLRDNITWLEQVGRAFNGNLAWKVFGKSSMPSERCHQNGLLMVMK